MSQSADDAIVDSRRAMTEDPQTAPQRGEMAAIPWVATWIVLASLSAVVASILVMVTPGPRGWFLPVLAAAVCIAAALFDAWTTRIPNHLTYPAILLGLALNGVGPLLEMAHAHSAAVWLGGVGPLSSLAGFAACALLAVPAMLAAGVHGGDLKLLAAMGALLGLVQTGGILLVALTLALLYSLLNLLLRGHLNAILQIAGQRALELVYLRRFHTPLPDENPPRASHIPMAVPLALGMIVAQLWPILTGGTIL